MNSVNAIPFALRLVVSSVMFSSLLLLCNPARLRAASLLIDFNSNSQDGGPHLQAGYQDYNASNEVAEDFITRSYSAFGTTVSLTPTWPDTTANTVMQMVDRNSNGPPVSDNDADYIGEMLDLVTDFIGADARSSQGGNGTESPTSLSLTLSGLPAGNYYYRAYHHDTSYQNANMSITLTDADGTALVREIEGTGSGVLATNPDPENPGMGYGPDVLPSTVVIPFHSDGGDVVLQYQTYEVAGNIQESFIVINAIEIHDQPIVPSVPVLTIDRTTGELTLSNDTGAPVTFLGYSITSVSGTLDPSQWTSIAENYDVDNPGPNQVDPDDPWVELTDPSSVGDLSEFQLGGSGPQDGVTLSSGKSISLGVGAWSKNHVEDLVASLVLSDGSFMPVIEEYVGNGGFAFPLGDFDFDNDLDLGDYVIFLAGLHQDLSGLSLAQAYRMGDLNEDLVNNRTDFLLFRKLYNEANGAGAFEAMVTGVPEPAGFALFGLGSIALIGLVRGRRKPRSPKKNNFCAKRISTPMSTRHSLPFIFLCAASILCFVAHSPTFADLLVYDGFEYTSGTDIVDNTSDGGASFGWETMSWQDPETSTTMLRGTDGLSYSRNGTALVVNGGHAVRDTNQSQAPVMYRKFTTPLGGGDKNTPTPIDPPQTVWISMLVQDVADILDGGADAFPNVLIGPGPNPDSTSTNLFNDGSYLGQFKGNANQPRGVIGPTDSTTSNDGSWASFGVVNNDVHMVVARYVFGGLDDDVDGVNTRVQIDAWLDPIPGLDPESDPFYVFNPDLHLISSNNARNWTMNGIGVRSENAPGEVNLDEIRVGEDWSDVLPSTTVPVAPFRLEVNTASGRTRIVNDSGFDLDFNYYEITSTSPSLDPIGWNSLDDQNLDATDGNDSGSIAGDSPGEGWDEAGGASSTILSEVFLLDSTLFDDGDVLDLGSAFDAESGILADVQFYLSLTDETLLGAAVTAIVAGDMDGDGDVDEVDVPLFVQALTNRTAYNSSFPNFDADFIGDFDGNGLLDFGDVAQFSQAIANAVSGSTESSAVPEPASALLITLATCCFACGRRRHSRRTTN